MCSTKFVIDVEKPAEGVYRGGCKVTGVVKYKLYVAIKFQYFRLTLSGKSKCKNFSDIVDIDFEEKHVSQTIKLLTKTKNKLPGNYSHQFQFILPEDIPPTFKMKSDVKITYILRLRVKHDCYFKCLKSVEQEILVYGNYGAILRSLPTSAGRVFAIEKKITNESSQEPGTIRVLVFVDKAFVTPGEFLNLRFRVTNLTDTPISCIKSKIVCMTTLRSEFCLVHDIFSKSYDEFAVHTAEIPTGPEIDLDSSIQVRPEYYSIPKRTDWQAIAVEYFLKVSVLLPLPPPNRKESNIVPIVVGVKPGMEDLGVIEFDDVKDIEKIKDALKESKPDVQSL